VLFLVHHGDAVDAGSNPMRPLSDRGAVETNVLAEKAAARGARPDRIWHSGKLRARQTAEAYWRHGNPFASCSAVHGLQPGDPTNWIVDALEAETGDVMLVGHFPQLPRLLARLISGDSEAGPVDFPPNGIVALEKTNEKWTERWRMSPTGC
jgi:phosphohistidine phosphatase